MNRYETNSKGTSPALSAILNEFTKMPKSAFDESRRKTFDASPYAIVPIECFLMFPNSKGYLNYSINAISKNPFIRRILSSMNIELRTYKCRCSDLWEGWNNFITKGRSGKLDKKIPSILFEYTTSNGNISTSLPYNPYSYLNIAPPVYAHSDGGSPAAIDQSFENNTMSKYTSDLLPTGLLGSSFTLASSKVYNEGISALPAVMYCKIAKEYQNSNLLQNNPYWYPENENHDLILPYSCDNVTTACYDYPNAKLRDTLNSTLLNSGYPTNDKHSMPWLNTIYYRQRKGNYFNTGSPFPDLLRGDVPTLDVLGASVDFTNVVLPGLANQDPVSGDIGPFFLDIGKEYDADPADPDYLFAGDIAEEISSGVSKPYARAGMSTSDLLKVLNRATVKNINFNMNAWRQLATLTVFREKMARTDGSYNQMIQAQFQHNPNWHEHSVVYCGGSSQPIVFSEVVQTSEDGNSPLGTTGGRAVSSSGSKEIEVNADDYTIFMTVMTITPDDYYSQGIDRMWSELTQGEQYFPILNNLEPQAIKNKELFLTGTDSDDDDIFNYQELFSHFKSRQNQVSGMLALPISKVGDTGAYLLNRIFTAKPQFNNAFVTGKLTTNENLVWSSTEQAQFVFDIVSQFKYVAPMPAVTQASDMGLSYA